MGILGRISGKCKSERSGGEAASTAQQSGAATSNAQRDRDAGDVATVPRLRDCRVRSPPHEVRSPDPESCTYRACAAHPAHAIINIAREVCEVYS